MLCYISNNIDGIFFLWWFSCWFQDYGSLQNSLTSQDDGSHSKLVEIRAMPPCGFSRQLQSVEVKLSVSELQSSKTVTASKKQRNGPYKCWIKKSKSRIVFTYKLCKPCSMEWFKVFKMHFPLSASNHSHGIFTEFLKTCWLITPPEKVQ